VSQVVRARRLLDLFTAGPLAPLLREGAPEGPAADVDGDSLDAQVDRYLAQYEHAAGRAQGDEPAPVDQMESMDWNDLVRGCLVEAQGGDDADSSGPDEPVDPTPKLSTDSIDVEAFANSVARMVENYDSLLEVRSTLVRRARAFLAGTYDDEVLTAFDSSMRDDHGMEPGKSPDELAADASPAPAADRANGNAQPGPGGPP